MNSFFTTIKKPICLITILSMVFSLFPIIPPGEAKAGARDWMSENILSKIPLPDELRMDEEGYVSMGNWFLVCPYKVVCDPKTDSDCHIKKLINGQEQYAEEKNESGNFLKCKNFFSEWSLGTMGQVAVADKETGVPLIANPELPKDCNFRIPPFTYQTTSQEQMVAFRSACIKLSEIQKAASMQAYMAKKLSNATDPLSSCFFLRNCKSECFLKLGSVEYTITMVDIAELLLPGSWVIYVKKIANIMGALKQLRTAWVVFERLANDGVAFITNLFSLGKNFLTLFDAMGELGTGWTAALVGDPGGAEGSLRKMLREFAGGLQGYQDAKNAALTTVSASTNELKEIREKIKTEKEVAFLFDPSSADSKELRGFLQDYLVNIQSLEDTVSKLIEDTAVVDIRIDQDNLNYKYENGIGTFNLKDQCKNALDCITFGNNCDKLGNNINLKIPSNFSNVCHSLFGDTSYRNSKWLSNLTKDIIENKYTMFFDGENAVPKVSVINIKTTGLQGKGQELIHERFEGEPGVSYTSSTESKLCRRIITKKDDSGLDWLEEYQQTTGALINLKHYLTYLTRAFSSSDKIASKKGTSLYLTKTLYFSDMLSNSLANLSERAKRCGVQNNPEVCGPDIYWKFKSWVKPEGVACINTETYKSDILSGTGYDAGLEEYDWGLRTDVLKNTLNKIYPLVNMVADFGNDPRNEMSPEDPEINFYLELAKNKLAKNGNGLLDLFINDLETLKLTNCQTGYNNCYNYCDDNSIKSKSDCRKACKKFSNLNLNASYNSCYSSCNSCSNSTCSKSRCRTACKAGRDVCPALSDLQQIAKKYDLRQKRDDLVNLLADIQNDFSNINKIWKEVPSNMSHELEVAGSYADKVARTKQVSINILAKVVKMEDIYKSLAKAIDETFDIISKGGLSEKDRQKLDNDTNNLKNFLDKLVSYSGNDIDNVMSKIRTMVGVYICTNDKGFLNRVKCFEEKALGGKTFENLSKFLLDASGVEEAIDEVIDAEGSLKSNITELKPKLRTDEVSINSNAVDQLVSAGITKIKGGETAELNLFTGASNWDEFQSKVLETPIAFLQNTFDSVQNLINNIKGPLMSNAESSVKSFLGEERYKNKDSNNPGYQGYFDIFKTKISFIERSVFGEDELRKGCEPLSPIFLKDPSQIKESCNKANDDILKNKLLVENCTLWRQAGGSDKKDFVETLITKINTDWNVSPNSRCCVDGATDKFCLKGCVNTEGARSENDHLCDFKKPTDENGNEIKDNKGNSLPEEQINCKLPCNKVQNNASLLREHSFDFLTRCVPMMKQREALATIKCVNNRNQTVSCNSMADDEFKEFTQKCQEVFYQKDLAKECGEFGTLSAALQNKCGSLGSVCKSVCPDSSLCRNICECKEKTVPCKQDCNTLRNSVNGICSSKYGAKCSDPAGTAINIPDLTKTDDDTRILRQQVEEICLSEMNDIKSNLTKVMKVLYIIMGVGSGKAIFDGLKDMGVQAKKIMTEAQALKDMIEISSKNISKSWTSDTTSLSKGGLKLSPFSCKSLPMKSVSIDGSGEKTVSTGPNGGQVCPAVPELFSSIDDEFNLIRKTLFEIDQSRRQVKNLEIGPLTINSIQKYPTFPDISGLYDINDVYKDADKIKDKAMFLWTIGVAMDFVSQECTCGQSYCKLCAYSKDGMCQVPICVSGIPLTVAPLEEPYCYLTYILRWPLKNLALNLEEYLKVEK